jgi:sigma-B regulation protein RsbU (phosphoserine phosphatase)
MKNMGNDLALKTRDVLSQRASLELKSLVEEHATILRRERDLVEMALQVQASELEKRFAAEPIQSENGNFDEMAEPGTIQYETQPSTKHLRVHGRMQFRPIYVSYKDQTYLYPSSISKNDNDASFSRISDMVSVYRSLERKHPDLIFWQITILENGTQTIYPAVRHIPMMYNTFMAEWYHLAREKPQVIWSKPVIDPFTMQLVFTVSAPFFNPEGKLAGVTAIVVPVDALLQVDEHIRELSKNVISLLVRTENSNASDKPAIRILGRGQIQKKIHHHWQASLSKEWLKLKDKSQLQQILNDLENHKTDVRETHYLGQESLMAYGCIDDYCTALLLIVPKTDVIAEAVAMETYVLDRIGQQIKITRVILFGGVLVVICLALILSRSVTKDINKVVNAVRRVAAGDFATRVHIKSRDEMGELGRTFDHMVPDLEEHVKMKQALDVAMEVQQNLLPREMPKFDGLDIAAKSIYCDETGGDFYDFMDFCCRDRNVLGVAIGDVSDHGLSAALLMATARAFLRCRVTQPGKIMDIINSVNALLARDTAETNQFVTLFYMEIDHKNKTIEWIRAGHDPAVLYDPSTDIIEELRGSGLSLGINHGFNYPANVKTGLSQGQIILMGTDGIWETRNSSGEMFGKERLNDLIRLHSQSSANEILNSVVGSLEKFRDEAKQEDDVTLVVIKIVE